MVIIIRKLSRPGCRPCAILANYLEEIAQELTLNGAILVNHDISREPELVEKYDITSVPVLIFERNGVEVARINGLVAPQEILDTLEHAKVVR